MNTWPAAQMSPGPLGGVWIGWECRKDVVGPWWQCGNPLSDCGERQTVSLLMTCVDAPNCTWTDLAMPTLAGVNCAKHWEESIWQSIEDSKKKTVAFGTPHNIEWKDDQPWTVLQGPSKVKQGVVSTLCKVYPNIVICIYLPLSVFLCSCLVHQDKNIRHQCIVLIR